MATKELDYSVVTQRVDCVFGHDHYITAKIREDKSLDTVYTTCSADKAETEGLILLGTDPMKTCLGYMDVFLKHIKNEVNHYDLNPLYRNTFLYMAGQPIASSVSHKSTERKAEQLAEVQRVEAEKSEGLVQRRLREFMAKSVGNAIARKFRITQEEDGHYTFNVLKGMTYDHRARKDVGGNPVPIADRKNGEWRLRYGWDQNTDVFAHTGRWGGDCAFCGVSGNRDHDDKKGHIRKTTQGIFKALQASSQAGIRIVRDGVLDKDGDPVEFKYRSNSKKFIGVVLPEPAPVVRDWTEDEYAAETEGSRDEGILRDFIEGLPNPPAGNKGHLTGPY
jgi:hypothetical protein